jgi:hypothetical protein
MRQPAAEEADAGGKRVRPSGPELPEDAYEETAEDKNFIDDEGESSTLHSLQVVRHGSSCFQPLS